MAPSDDLRGELQRRQSNADAVLALFKARPGEWIDWTELAQVGGALAWRTRVADCRRIVKAEGGDITNRQRRDAAIERDGTQQPSRLMIGRVISEYRYLVQTPHGRSADVPVPDHWPAFDAPIQETWKLTPPETR